MLRSIVCSAIAACALIAAEPAATTALPLVWRVSHLSMSSNMQFDQSGRLQREQSQINGSVYAQVPASAKVVSVSGGGITALRIGTKEQSIASRRGNDAAMAMWRPLQSGDRRRIALQFSAEMQDGLTKPDALCGSITVAVADGKAKLAQIPNWAQLDGKSVALDGIDPPLVLRFAIEEGSVRVMPPEGGDPRFAGAEFRDADGERNQRHGRWANWDANEEGIGMQLQKPGPDDGAVLTITLYPSIKQIVVPIDVAVGRPAAVAATPDVRITVLDAGEDGEPAVPPVVDGELPPLDAPKR